MRLAMAQMRMHAYVQENLQKSLYFMEKAKAAGADLIFFPELQLSPFFPQHEKTDAMPWLMGSDSPEIDAIWDKCRHLL